MQLGLADRFDAELRRLTQGNIVKALGVAVSGGSDSMALLHLTHDWGQKNGVRVHAATVDHKLRNASSQEAAQVGQICAGLDVPHTILSWSNWDGQGNLQMSARIARRALISDWAEAEGTDAVVVGHTADDQVETFLMRLARGSGVDGLAGMAREAHFLRPLLGMTRQDLQTYLCDRNLAWFEDPSNDDSRFDRVKARKMMAHLAELGLSRARVLQTVGHMTRAKRSLNVAIRDLAQCHVAVQSGDLILGAPIFFDLESDHPWRLVSAALQWVNGGAYRPRFEALQRCIAAYHSGKTTTLAGCLLTPDAGTSLRITRELSAVGGTIAPVLAGNGTWDRRWQLQQTSLARPPNHTAIEIRALGDAGLAHCPDWRTAALPRRSLLSTPAVWHGDHLISAPLAGYGHGWDARIVTDFHEWLVSH